MNNFDRAPENELNELSEVQSPETQRLTTADILAHVFAVGLLIVTLPIFFSPPSPSSQAQSPNRVMLPLRLSR
ncbi:MAG: hypothetical protein KME06_03860 [Kastovskya adunca ATA6-11-RM4]|jgi:hypothetical protein|nr:hypothetical protein [Kastovskya adunca ATA6-11-RM4]